LEADYVIVTAPLGVLKNKDIDFFPSLPKSKLDAVAGLGINAIKKFLCIWDDAFWGRESQYLGYTLHTTKALPGFAPGGAFCIRSLREVLRARPGEQQNQSQRAAERTKGRRRTDLF
jgi:hypothetical protein